MDKLEEFKLFVKDKPYLANKVKDGTFSWQTLYETYDIFGKDHEFFKEEVEEKKVETKESKDSLNRIAQISNRLDIIADEHSVYVNNKVFNH